MLTVTLFIFGMMFGEMVFGPLSDSKGRKVAILSGLAVYALGTVASMTAPSIEWMIAGRILQGVGVAGPKIGARAAIRDRFSGEAMAQAMSLIMTVFMLVPMLAPTIGQILLKAAGWQAIFVAFLVMAGIGAVWLWLRQPETLAPGARIPLHAPSIATNAVRVVLHPHVLGYTLAAGCTFGAHLHYLSIAQSLIGEVYGMGDWFPAVFAIVGLALAVAFFTNAQLVMQMGMVRLVRMALWGQAVIATLMLIAALISGGVPSFWVFLPGFLALFFCIGILLGNLNALAMQVLGQMAGIGTSVVASVSSLLAVIIALLAGWAYDETLVPVSATFMFAPLLALFLLSKLQVLELIPVTPRRS